MGRGIQVIVICEDLQQAVFVRAFLYRRRFTHREIRVEICKEGDAKKHVRDLFPAEVRALRQYHGTRRMLIVMTDADDQSVEERLGTLDQALAAQGIDPIRSGEPIFRFVPKWEIETWLKYLKGDTADENEKKNPKLEKESDAYKLVDRLVDMCDRQLLQPEPPPSLEMACRVYDRMKNFLSEK